MAQLDFDLLLLAHEPVVGRAREALAAFASGS